MDTNHSKNSVRASDFSFRTSGIEIGAIHTAPGVLQVHKLLPMAILYFFLNSVGLPTGLFYTTLLAPLFYLWLCFEGKRWVTLKFVACLSPFTVMHLHNGIESPYYYARSVLLLWTVYVTVYAFCWALLKYRNIERLFEQLLVLNFCVAIIAFGLLFTPWKGWFWSLDFRNLGGNGDWAPRLMLLASEPSVYGQLMAPLLIFTVLRLFHNLNRRNLKYVAMIAIPLLLSQSFGAISICLAGLVVALLPRSRRLMRRKGSVLILCLGALLVVGILFVPNPIQRRAFQVAMGADSSTQFRTVYSFIAAYGLAASKSLWWGVGIGQAKLYTGTDFVRFLGFTSAVLINSVADTLADLGIIAVVIRFILEIYLFFRTRVYADSFRLAMFVLPFIYQFTGSNLMNVQEYLLWCFAFAPIFPWLNQQSGIVAAAPSKATRGGGGQ